jgi:hypothetical protein
LILLEQHLLGLEKVQRDELEEMEQQVQHEQVQQIYYQNEAMLDDDEQGQQTHCEQVDDDELVYIMLEQLEQQIEQQHDEQHEQYQLSLFMTKLMTEQEHGHQYDVEVEVEVDEIETLEKVHELVQLEVDA